METIDEKYQLNFVTNSGEKIVVNSILRLKIEEYDMSPFPDNTKIDRLQ